MKSLAVKVRIPNHTGRILDVGSGNNCLDIATHLIDLMPDSNSERGGDLERAQGKIFKEGNVEAIPFDDLYFDFAQASHVLEHVESPDRAIRELTRVARAGYIETPAAVIEQGSNYRAGKGGWDFHRWYVWAFPKQDKLFFKPKTQANLTGFCECRYGQTVREVLKLTEFQDLYPYFPYSCVMTQFVWSGKIQFEIWNENQQGSQSGEFGCDCPYAAFFANARKNYFSSLPQIRRKLGLRRSYPQVYRILKSAL